VDSHASLGASRLHETHVSAEYFQHPRLIAAILLSTIFWANLDSSLSVQCATRIRCMLQRAGRTAESLHCFTAATDNVGAMWTSHLAPGNVNLYSVPMCAASGNRREKNFTWRHFVSLPLHLDSLA
jgi:hypothetical protein